MMVYYAFHRKEMEGLFMNTLDLDKINLFPRKHRCRNRNASIIFFMAKLRALVSEKSKKLGRPRCKCTDFWLSDECQRQREDYRNPGDRRL